MAAISRGDRVVRPRPLLSDLYPITYRSLEQRFPSLYPHSESYGDELRQQFLNNPLWSSTTDRSAWGVIVLGKRDIRVGLRLDEGGRNGVFH